MTNIIVILVIIAIIGGAVAKIVSEKKKGAKCIGCSAGGTSKNSCGSNIN
ncbi:FeoB-associated Cys-rich membrane protein [Anaerobacillus sp. HL2]|nr:FeoB-associated Cys-rich membrane protein [Anaerobacillus sp. HL2]